MIIKSLEKKNIYLTKNLELKKKLCNQAKDLLEKKNLGSTYRALQVLHNDWKRIGPTEKKYKKKVWQEFQEITRKIHKQRRLYLKTKGSTNKERLNFNKEIDHLIKQEPRSKNRDRQQDQKNKDILKVRIAKAKQDVRQYNNNLIFLAKNEKTAYLKKEIEQKIKKNLQYISSLEKKLTTFNKR